jgi:hypothetical protein
MAEPSRPIALAWQVYREQQPGRGTSATSIQGILEALIVVRLGATAVLMPAV